MIFGTSETWVAEWSHNQKCFHVDMLDESIRHNRQNYFANKGNDYIILGIFRGPTEANNFIERLKAKKRQG